MFNHDRGFLLLSEHSYTFMYLIKGVFSPTVKLCSSILSEKAEDYAIPNSVD